MLIWLFFIRFGAGFILNVRNSCVWDWVRISNLKYLNIHKAVPNLIGKCCFYTTSIFLDTLRTGLWIRNILFTICVGAYLNWKRIFFILKKSFNMIIKCYWYKKGILIFIISVHYVKALLSFLLNLNVSKCETNFWSPKFPPPLFSHNNPPFHFQKAPAYHKICLMWFLILTPFLRI